MICENESLNKKIVCENESCCEKPVRDNGSAHDRLDVRVARETGYSRGFSADIIKRGLVAVDGKAILKPGWKIDPASTLTIDAPENVYVGRGGYKLEFALDYFKIDLSGKTCADVGASTGGFTDCMLHNNAAVVYAIDNGHAQLAQSLRREPRVVSLEDTNVNDLAFSPLAAAMDFVAVDVSFVSISKIINSVAGLIKPGGTSVLLIKPQFEAGPGFVGKSGVVRDARVHKRVLRDVGLVVADAGLSVLGLVQSPVRGKDGNTEFLLHCIKIINVS